MRESISRIVSRSARETHIIDFDASVTNSSIIFFGDLHFTYESSSICIFQSSGLFLNFSIIPHVLVNRSIIALLAVRGSVSSLSISFPFLPVIISTNSFTCHSRIFCLLGSSSASRNSSISLFNTHSCKAFV